MKFRIEHIYDVEPEHFWREVFFDEEYNQTLYREALGFGWMRVVEQSGEPGGALERTVEAKPNLHMPRALEKVFGDPTYMEEGRFDPDRGRWCTRIRIPGLDKKVDIRSEMWLEDLGDGRARRLVDSTVEARVFGLGKLIEKFVERSIRDSYANTAAFTNRWLNAR